MRTRGRIVLRECEEPELAKNSVAIGIHLGLMLGFLDGNVESVLIVFTDRCQDPSSERGMPTVPCSTVCISLLEPDVEAGVFIGYKHIRGCMDRVLRHGFNQTALRTHRFHNHNHCRTLSRAHLFNPARATDPPAIGDVQLCSCYGDRCNGSNQAQLASTLVSLVIAVIFSYIFQ
ncbi:unnamed protein product [Angiostrongylus costaricensis]|uniref:Protein quiver n=1 Tax=Angiostrongylus costaricensis TaxID=334426 RepID=A0A0R3PHY0_ANGCS|nr:unnamed protein product [Angiostrongylus costaricensis]